MLQQTGKAIRWLHPTQYRQGAEAMPESLIVAVSLIALVLLLLAALLVAVARNRL